MSNIRKETVERPLVSIIVPVYNYEKYLPKCLESLVNQTYENLEIILINDGSTDKSGEICDEYAEKDSRIVVRHKENGGIGSAYKVAFELCTGDYIAFVDSDDYLDLNSYERQVKVALETNADIVESGEYMVGLDGKIRSTFQLREEQICGNKEVMIDYLVHNTLTPLGMKFCKAELYQGIMLPSVSVGIDEIISIQVMLKAKKVVKTGEVLYYVLGEPGKDSVSRRAIDGKHLLNQVNMHNDIIQMIKKANKSYIPFYIVRYLRFLRGMYIYRCDKKSEVAKLLLDEYKKYYLMLNFKNLTAYYGKAVLLSFKVFYRVPSLYRAIWKLKKTELDE